MGRRVAKQVSPSQKMTRRVAKQVPPTQKTTRKVAKRVPPTQKMTRKVTKQAPLTQRMKQVAILLRQRKPRPKIPIVLNQSNTRKVKRRMRTLAKKQQLVPPLALPPALHLVPLAQALKHCVVI